MHVHFLKRKPQIIENQLFGVKLSWPTRTRTLNDGTKNRSVANYTMGQSQDAKNKFSFRACKFKTMFGLHKHFTIQLFKKRILFAVKGLSKIYSHIYIYS